jgi:hypothetical protein
VRVVPRGTRRKGEREKGERRKEKGRREKGRGEKGGRRREKVLKVHEPILEEQCSVID